MNISPQSERLGARCCASFFVGLTISVLTSCGYASKARYEVGDNVPVTASSSNWYSDDLKTIIVTDIYPYRINTPQGQEFIVTGPPISFAFPKAAYANYENGKGGPQASVDLRLDRVTLNPFANLLAERGIQNFERTSKNVKDVEHRKLNVQIFSNYLRPSVKTQFSYWLQDVDNSTKIRICDFEFFRVFGNSSYYENLSDANIGGINVEPATYKGISSGVGSSARIAECTIGSPICRVSFDYRSREVRFDIPRSDFCLNQDLTSKLRRLLAYHEIKGSQ